MAKTYMKLDGKLVPVSVGTGTGGGGGITKKTVSIPFTEIMSETMTTIEVTYNYVGDDPVNLTADFSSFEPGLTVNLGSGPVPASMIVQAIFGKTILNYFEIIILFRYIITATIAEVMPGGLPNANYAFEGINDVNINDAVFTVDFMTQCQDIPFYNTLTGRGSDMNVEVDTFLDLGLGPVFAGMGMLMDNHFSYAWSTLSSATGSGITNHFVQHLSGMTLRLSPDIRVSPKFNGGMFLD